MLQDNRTMKAGLFDLDGVVFDTEPQYTIFWGGIFKEYYPGSEGMEQKIKGQTLVQIYDKYFPSKEDQTSITARLNDYERHMAYPYIAGFETFIKQLKANGIPTAVATSSNKDKMENVYRRHPEFKSYFDAILTSEDFAESKPSPDCYLRAAGRLGAKPEDCVVFEDSFNGLKSGRASGARVVGLATTNSAESIAPYCDEVIKDYENFSIK